MDQHKPFVIVVDDDDEDRYLLNHSFTEIGLGDNIKFFGDALQFIRYAELIGSLNVKPSLIILDYRMPYMNGKAVVTYLKQSEWLKEIPVVILSNQLTDDVQSRLLEMGVTACFGKDTDYKALARDLADIVQYTVPQ
jgi:CheY-like chemotaxis protein